MYSHDTYGLGHLTRSTRLAAGIVDAMPDASVLVLSGSPIAHRFRFPPGVDYIKLPSVVKAGPDAYPARELAISAGRIRRMRRRVILGAVEQFDPHLLMVDNVPLGMRGELEPTLQMLRRRSRRTRIHLNLRDILDAPETIQQSWKEAGTYTLEDCLGDENVEKWHGLATDLGVQPVDDADDQEDNSTSNCHALPRE